MAELADISVDWYVRLEQGRTVSPSAATIDALAYALRLSRAEHTHLRTLARSAGQPAFVREYVPDTLRRLVKGLDHPAYITGRRWDVLAWNAAAATVLIDFDHIAEADRNILLYMLTDPNARRLFGMVWADEAKRMIAQFRKTYDLWADDPAFLELLARLRQGSPEFGRWWEAHDIRDVSAGEKQLNHPEQGAMRFEYATFQTNDDPALKLAIYTPV